MADAATNYQKETRRSAIDEPYVSAGSRIFRARPSGRFIPEIDVATAMLVLFHLSGYLSRN